MYMERVYVQQNGEDNVINLGLILFRDQVNYSPDHRTLNCQKLTGI